MPRSFGHAGACYGMQSVLPCRRLNMSNERVLSNSDALLAGHSLDLAAMTMPHATPTEQLACGAQVPDPLDVSPTRQAYRPPSYRTPRGPGQPKGRRPTVRWTQEVRVSQPSRVSKPKPPSWKPLDG
jgi:hypothetical protein